jgi:hypothetical protein
MDWLIVSVGRAGVFMAGSLIQNSEDATFREKWRGQHFLPNVDFFDMWSNHIRSLNSLCPVLRDSTFNAAPG